MIIPQLLRPLTFLFFAFGLSAHLWAASAEPAQVVLSLPKGTPEQFSVTLPIDQDKLTLHLTAHRVMGEHTRFLVPDEFGNLQEVPSDIQSTYLGTVEGRPEYLVSAVLSKQGLMMTIRRAEKAAILITPNWDAPKRGLHWISTEDVPSEGGCQCGACLGQGHTAPLEDTTPHTPANITATAPSSPSGAVQSRALKSPIAPKNIGGATLPPTRVIEVLEYEVGVEIGSRAFENNYGSNLASAQAAAASIAMNMDARYLRGAGIKHVLGTVMIRTNPATDPLRNSVTATGAGADAGSSLEAFRNYWNDNVDEVGDTHDLAVYHVRASPSGLAFVNSVGTSRRYATSGSNAATSWADGTLVHEFGHSWNLRHTGSAPINEYDYESGQLPPNSFYEAKPRSNTDSAGGDHTFVSVMHGGGSHNIGRLSTDEANTVLAVKENKRSFGRVITNPAQVPPFGHRDSVTATVGSSVLIDVIANDYDANNDVLNVVLRDSVSHQGGRVSLSSGTGPGGRDELRYTPPAVPSSAVDFFHYTVSDSQGGRDFGAVYVSITQALLYSESFLYPAGSVAGRGQGGSLWANQTGNDDSTVVTSEALLDQGTSTLLSAGGKITQAANNRCAITLPAQAAGGADGSVRYISFIQKLSSADTGKSQIMEFWKGFPQSSNTAFSFGTDTNGDAPDYGLLIDKDGAGIPLPLGSPDTDAHLVILKVEYGSGNLDKISVFFDPGASEPASAAASANATDLSFDRIGFGSFQGGGQEVDEIRIGSTYESVFPERVSQLFFQEDFTYAAGNLAGRSNNGNSWVDVTGAGMAFVTAEKAVQTGNHRTSITLPSEAIGGEDHTVRYLSFLQKFETDNSMQTKIMEFWNGPANANESIFSFGTDTNAAAPDYGLLIAKNTDNVMLDLGSADAQQHLIVLKLEYGPGSGDAISVYLDPGMNEPASPDGIAFYPDLSFDTLGFGSFQNGMQEIDEIKIGASFADVVPLSPPLGDTDADGDGLPDDFERRHYDATDLSVTDGSDDLDGDGSTDAAEFLAGTDPTDASSVFRISSLEQVTDSEFLITWNSVSGITYSVWESADLAAGSWSLVVPSITATGASTQAPLSSTEPRMFFQIRVRP